MAKQVQEMVCINCPLGCRMELEIEDGEIKAVQHNSCKRGIEYAQQEFYDPRRMVTATAAITGGAMNRVPVRTTEPIPINHINGVLQAIYTLNLFAPLKIETAVIKNFADTGIDVITTRNIPKAF
jgi:CxxC motif-containing protein